MCIGPKQIYLSTDRQQEFFAILNENGPQAVEKFKQFSQMDSGGEFLKGMSSHHNMLMLAVGISNEYIVKYILENANSKILDMYDGNGRSALYHAVDSGWEADIIIARARILIQEKANKIVDKTGKEKNLGEDGLYKMASIRQNRIIACARLLLQAGADTTVGRTGKVEEPGEDPLGYVVRTLQCYDNDPTNYAKERMQLLCELFVENGVTNACSSARDKSKKAVGLFSIDESIDEQTAFLKANFVRKLQASRIQVCNNKWPKIRLVLLLSSTIPYDLKGLVIKKIMDA